MWFEVLGLWLLNLAFSLANYKQQTTNKLIFKFIFMLPFFWYMLKVIICSGILFAYYWIFLRNKIFHGYNRFYLLASILLSLVLPILKINFWQPAGQQNQAIRILQTVSVGDDYMSRVVISGTESSWKAENLYMIVYILVSVIFLVALLRTLFLIRTLLKNYPVQHIEEVAFINTQHQSTPFSFLKYIFWNSDIDMDTITGKQIFKHEVAHIQQKHTHDKLFVNIVLIFYWCNPFFWLYRRELNMIHEFIADKKAVEDSDTAAFAAMILQAAYPKQQFELVNNFFYSPIKRRLLMLSKNKNPRVNYLGRIMVLPLMVLVFAAFSLKTKDNKKQASELEIPAIHETAATIEIPATTLSLSIADTVPARAVTGVNPNSTDPLYIVNGKETDKAIAVNIQAADIEDMRVIKDAAVLKLYGEKGKNGVVIINTKAGAISPDYWTGGSLTVHGANISQVLGKSPLLIVDNIEYPGKTLNEIAALNGIKRLENIDIYGAEAMKTYGEKARDGLIIAYTSAARKELTEIRSENDLPLVNLADSMGLAALKLKQLKEEELSAKTLYEQKVVVGMKLNDMNLQNQKLMLQMQRKANTLLEEKMATERRLTEQEMKLRKLQLEKQKQELQLASLNYANAPQKQPEVIEVQGKAMSPVFTEVEQPARFTGGKEAWQKFLQKNLKANTPVDHGAKAGIYKVELSFIINIDGSLSDIRCEKDPGFGTCEEAIRLIKTTPKWQPAVQNGKKVKCYFRQPITFVVEDAGVKQQALLYKVPLKVHTLDKGEIKTYHMADNGEFIIQSNLLYYVNGQVSNNPESVIKSNILYMESYDAASGKKLFGEKGKNGVLLLRTKS